MRPTMGWLRTPPPPALRLRHYIIGFAPSSLAVASASGVAFASASGVASAFASGSAAPAVSATVSATAAGSETPTTYLHHLHRNAVSYVISTRENCTTNTSRYRFLTWASYQRILISMFNIMSFKSCKKLPAEESCQNILSEKVGKRP